MEGKWSTGLARKADPIRGEPHQPCNGICLAVFNLRPYCRDSLRSLALQITDRSEHPEVKMWSLMQLLRRRHSWPGPCRQGSQLCACIQPLLVCKVIVHSLILINFWSQSHHYRCTFSCADSADHSHFMLLCSSPVQALWNLYSPSSIR